MLTAKKFVGISAALAALAHSQQSAWQDLPDFDEDSFVVVDPVTNGGGGSVQPNRCFQVSHINGKSEGTFKSDL